jgi:beta-galactosidase
MNKRTTILLALFSFMVMPSAHPRTKKTINEDWKFYRNNIEQAYTTNFNDSDWQSIDLPHTWNNLDAIDEVKGYDRMECWYRKSLYIGKEDAKTHSFLFFEGVNQIADVYVNGQFVGQHKGGYTQFNFEITPFINYDALNSIAIKVDNRHNVDIPPLSADFTFFGGIYRDVFLVHTNAIHFDNSNYASSGVYITTPSVSKEKATVKILSHIKNESAVNQHVIINYTIIDKSGEPIYSTNKKTSLKKQGAIELIVDDIKFTSPNLWSPGDPYLYKVITQIKDETSGEVLDEVIQPLGFRWFKFTADKGFFINGEHLKLIGTNRHQDYLKMGNALPDEMHIRDVKLLKEMGGNFLRIAHYPQDPTVLEMCDKLGIITTIEIPVIDKITESQAFSDNCIYMAEEMVHQNFNHPSLVIWAYMNEVLLRPPFTNNKERHAKYVENVSELAQQIEDVIRAEDPGRYTMIPCHGAFDRYNDAKLTQIPMVVGWNLYQGWYGGEFPDFDKFLDRHRAELPDKPMIVTEYGADVHSRLHSFHPERFDYTVEYGNLYHEHYLKAIMERPFVAGANIWNLADFYSAYRGNARPTVNCKGIVGLDRELKDTYLLYKALLKDEPVLELGQKEWKIRGGIASDYSNQCIQPVNVYANTPEVELFHNGQSMGKKVVSNYRANWDVPFVDGINTLEVVCQINGKVYRDINKVDFRLIASDLKSEILPFKAINVSLGSQSYFEDKKRDIVWLPEKEYQVGNWGYVGGNVYRIKTNYGSLPLSNLDIKGTESDPVFQSQRVGIEAFKFDVPEGRYTLSLCWAELISDNEYEKLAYNLGNDEEKETISEREFKVVINGEPVEHKLNLRKKFGAEKAVTRKYEINVSDSKGITIRFEKISGETVLNALRLYKAL